MRLGAGQWIYRALLLVAGWVFFAWNDPLALIWLAGITLFGYGFGLALDDAAERRSLIALAIVGLVLILAFFKYGGSLLGGSPLIPLGLSYYSLMTVGYLIDVYRGTIDSEKNILCFALYVGFFPQVTAGPIGRAQSLLKQYHERITVSTTDVKTGFLMIILGVFEKYVLADNFRLVVDHVVDTRVGGVPLVLAMLLFSLVIYYDFAGYSLIAIGLGRLMGIRLTDNFHAPYLATSVRDFWRRWHISLSTWFRDYLYIPLGGSRGSKWRRDINTLLVFLVSGAWHGQALGFWMWGLLHGLYLVIENRIRDIGRRIRGDRPKQSFSRGVTALGHAGGRIIVFLLVSFAWVPFYAGDPERIFALYGRMFVGDVPSLGALWLDGFGMRWEVWLICGIGVLLLLVVSILQEHFSFTWFERMGRHGIVIFFLGIICYTVLLLVGVYGSQYDPTPFIYGGF